PWCFPPCVPDDVYPGASLLAPGFFLCAVWPGDRLAHGGGHPHPIALRMAAGTLNRSPCAWRRASSPDRLAHGGDLGRVILRVEDRRAGHEGVGAGGGDRA